MIVFKLFCIFLIDQEEADVQTSTRMLNISLHSSSFIVNIGNAPQGVTRMRRTALHECATGL